MTLSSVLQCDCKHDKNNKSAVLSSFFRKLCVCVELLVNFHRIRMLPLFVYQCDHQLRAAAVISS